MVGLSRKYVRQQNAKNWPNFDRYQAYLVKIPTIFENFLENLAHFCEILSKMAKFLSGFVHKFLVCQRGGESTTNVTKSNKGVQKPFCSRTHFLDRPYRPGRRSLLSSSLQLWPPLCRLNFFSEAQVFMLMRRDSCCFRGQEFPV